MRKSTRLILILVTVACAGAGVALAQRYGNRRGPDRRYSYRRPVPEWTPSKEFAHDVFTFVRIRYSSGYGDGGYGRRGFSGGNWATDYPDSDLNFSFRLHQLTAMEVDPNGVVLELTDPKLFDYPFIYIVEPGRLVFSEEEVKQLRRYLLNGGFLMVDDFWGEAEWDNFYYQIKRVFPEREPHELPLSHPIFHAVFDLKEKPQIPSINVAVGLGITYEREDAKTPHYKAIYDDKGRMMAMICHNTDLGDGWEREGEDEWYFREFSEKSAYPLGINIVFYAMTH
ncbi:MAG: transmembrane prediction [Planctomycetes bacterium RBG_16_55_9]|nr:MAG: transmembrane prediction [Planctomycetes bacterium RBG_16_55_9]